jgi:hypothetical protein
LEERGSKQYEEQISLEQFSNMEWRMCQIKYPKDREFFATPRIRWEAPHEAASFTRDFLIDDPPQTLSSRLI